MSKWFATVSFIAIAYASMASADIVPVYSELSITDASNQCNQVGQVIGLPMNTVTATAPNFYIVACARPDGNGGTTYVAAWSASSLDNANARCGTNSATTGLAAGVPVGQPLSITANTNDIFIVICSE